MTKTTARQIAEAFTGVARYSVTSEQVRHAYAVLARSKNVDDQHMAERMIDAAETAGIEL